MKQTTVNILLLCILLLIVLLVVMLFLKSSDCTLDPLVYGVKEISKSNYAEYTCYCTSDNPRVQPVVVNSTGLTVGLG